MKFIKGFLTCFWLFFGLLGWVGAYMEYEKANDLLNYRKMRPKTPVSYRSYNDRSNLYQAVGGKYGTQK